MVRTGTRPAAALCATLRGGAEPVPGPLAAAGSGRPLPDRAGGNFKVGQKVSLVLRLRQTPVLNVSATVVR
ncbi:hypothetical protein ACFSC4_05800 [Deinococcus malanensis]|uniref:hypothetical protein n=1 Tax=Deinococcus malanensis TaxID=1706855 RepID=UPI00362EDA4A